ncbi:MAG: type I-U CRISPR-associated protein Csx17, partial [Gammaproteobacteria bacterium]|nr:type I-U CRISPR-associated protein Csx17 [Gammaproteobacteria bacterium]
MIHVHQLDGCAPVPLAHYLKALGILRLVAEQADGEARGWWDGDGFRLGSRLAIDEVQSFFMERYSPTPMLAPWNGASGFFKTWDNKKSRLRNSKNYDALHEVLKRDEPRWVALQDACRQATSDLKAVAEVRDVSQLTDAERSKLLIIPSGSGPSFLTADKDGDKTRIQTAVQRTLNRIPFYRSAVIDVGGKKPAYPSIWGSGGNDGAIDFTARYMENLLRVLDPENAQSAALLSSSLTGSRVKGLLGGQRGKVGQFIPGGAGGANSVNGPGTQDDTVLNPWDFVLMLEGAVCFSSHVSRQSPSHSSQTASPFAVGACGAAYPSASTDDERSLRGEQWMPLWSRPSTYGELRRLFAEGRAQISSKTAQEPLDLARAVRRLGTARGVSTFQRYGYIERNGQSNLAVPLGRFIVTDDESEHLACIDDLDKWLRHVRQEARRDHSPARLTTVVRRLVDALFAVTEASQNPDRWQGVLFQLTAVEETMARGSGFAAQPVPRLRPDWVAASHDGSAEFRLALAFALQAREFRKQSGTPIDPIRRHWLPLDRERPWRFAMTGTGAGATLDVHPDVVMRGRRSIDDAIAVVERRLVEARECDDRYLPLKAARRASASIADLASLLAGGVDLDRTLTLARALMALDHRAWADQYMRVEPPPLLSHKLSRERELKLPLI